MGLTVYRQRTLSLSHHQLPAQVVYAVQEETKTGPGPGASTERRRKALRTFRLCVEHRADAGDDAPDAALDPLLTWAVHAICAPPATLGGLAEDIKELGTTWDEQEQDKVYAAARTFFEITYMTDAANPDTLT